MEGYAFQTILFYILAVLFLAQVTTCALGIFLHAFEFKGKGNSGIRVRVEVGLGRIRIRVRVKGRSRLD